MTKLQKWLSEKLDFNATKDILECKLKEIDRELVKLGVDSTSAE